MNKCNDKASEKCLDCRKCIIMKYVRNGFLDFVFAPTHILHRTIACTREEPVSAGFVNLSKMQVFGHSEGLGLKSKEEDSDLIKTLIWGCK